MTNLQGLHNFKKKFDFWMWTATNLRKIICTGETIYAFLTCRAKNIPAHFWNLFYAYKEIKFAVSQIVVFSLSL